MAVGASKPTVVADKDGFFSVKNKMLVKVSLWLHIEQNLIDPIWDIPDEFGESLWFRKSVKYD